MRTILVAGTAAGLLAAVASGSCQHTASCTAAGALAAPADLPDGLRVPAGAELFLRLRAEGQQIYRCQQTPAGAWAFALKAPDARLISDRCTEVGHHFAGPSWSLASDGSVVVGKKLAESPRADTIPWLLLSGTPASPGGAMAAVRFIQRVDTTGGVAPVEGCDQGSAGQEVAIPYSATYLYYRLATPAAAVVSKSRS